MNRNKSAEEIKLFDLTKEPRESDENYWPNLSSTTWAVIPLPDGVPAYWPEELPVESTKEMKQKTNQRPLVEKAAETKTIKKQLS